MAVMRMATKRSNICIRVLESSTFDARRKVGEVYTDKRFEGRHGALEPQPMQVRQTRRHVGGEGEQAVVPGELDGARLKQRGERTCG